MSSGRGGQGDACLRISTTQPVSQLPSQVVGTSPLLRPDRVFLCSLGCPGTLPVDQAGFKPASASWVMRLKVWATTWLSAYLKSLHHHYPALSAYLYSFYLLIVHSKLFDVCLICELRIHYFTLL